MISSLTMLQKMPTGKTLPITEAQGFISQLKEFYKLSNEHKENMAEINAKREILLKEIQNRYDFLHYVFSEIFAERKITINKHFEVIDDAIKKNDRESISKSLFSLSNIVVNNPISEMSKIKSIIESGGMIEL